MKADEARNKAQLAREKASKMTKVIEEVEGLFKRIDEEAEKGRTSLTIPEYGDIYMTDDHIRLLEAEGFEVRYFSQQYTGSDHTIYWTIKENPAQ